MSDYDAVYHLRGWACPICGNIYSPFERGCRDCNRRPTKDKIDSLLEQISRAYDDGNDYPEPPGVEED